MAHLATIRSVDEVTDEEIEAARQCEAAKAQLTADEELELLFPTGGTSEPANAESEPAETAVVAANHVAVEPATESKAAEPATLQILAGRVPVAPSTDFELDALWAPSQLAERFGLKLATLNKRLERWRAKHPGEGWNEVKSRAENEPKYLYRLSAVMPLIESMMGMSSEQRASNEMSA